MIRTVTVTTTLALAALMTASVTVTPAHAAPTTASVTALARPQASQTRAAHTAAPSSPAEPCASVHLPGYLEGISDTITAALAGILDEVC